MASRSEFKTAESKTGISAHPATLFTTIPSLQNVLIEKLLATHGGLLGTLKYIKTDKELDPVRQNIKCFPSKLVPNCCKP